MVQELIDELLGSMVLTQAVAFVVYLAAALIAGLIIRYGVYRVLRRLSTGTSSTIDDHFVRYTRKPASVIFPLLIFKLGVPLMGLPESMRAFVQHTVALCLIVAVGYLVISIVFALRDIVLERYDVGAEDNLRARKVVTQVHVLEKIVVVILVIVLASAGLMTFEGVRQIGVSLLASAGITGIIIGLAAQRTIATLLAGIQIAITQPIRLDDVVIVENEWGRVEEITLTFVVVRIWDLRRLVLPVNYFIEQPFQNWTRSSANILGTVYLYTDYLLPVEVVREQTRKIVEASGMWDGEVCGVQVTDSRETVMEVRLLVSAKDSSAAWNLRCHLREAMIGFVRENYPHCFPRTRAELLPSTSEGHAPEAAAETA
jgi:small-conductance mechanosensitive channel